MKDNPIRLFDAWRALCDRTVLKALWAGDPTAWGFVALATACFVRDIFALLFFPFWRKP